MKTKKQTLSLFLALIVTVCLILSGCGKQEQTSAPRYTVTFDLNGGELVSGTARQRVKEGRDAVPPEVTNGRMELTWDGDWTNITEDTTITARWSRTVMETSDLAEYVQTRTVTVKVTTITNNSGSGSGFFIDDQGTIVTNFHVIDGAAEISVETGSGATYPVQTVVDFSDLYDLAILRINLPDSPYLEFSDTPVRTGENVYAVGSALGTLTGSFTAGIVSSAQRSYGMIDCIQMDTAISPGNSGGPLVNGYGEVVGINTASYVSGENLNLAIKPEMLDKLSRDKNLTVPEYKSWYEQESSRSWSPVSTVGNRRYYTYSLVNTYQEITGVPCLYSVDDLGDDLDIKEGYYDCYDFYIYDYSSDDFERYKDYIKSVGYVFDSDSRYSDGGVSYYYYNEKDGFMLELYVTAGSESLWIYPIDCN